MNYRGKNGVKRPSIRPSDGNMIPTVIQRMNQIDPVYIRVIFDREKDPEVERRTNNSKRVLELLDEASLETGYVMELKLMGAPVGPRVLTRLNFLLSRTGWGEGSFRGWRRELQKAFGKFTWCSAIAWKDLLSILGYEEE